MSQALNFPARIYQILEHESCDIIQWNSNGLSFRIVDHIRFEAEIIPKYFRHRKISSVQRQLNVYGFRSISRGEHKRSFYHPLFKRGNWEVVKQMARYVPPKGGLGDVDPEHIETAILGAPQVKAERDIESCAPVRLPEVSHWAAHTQSGLSRKLFTPSYVQQPASSSVSIRGDGVLLDRVKASGSPTCGTVQINMNDAADNHFANDFYETTAVGTEANHVTIQPVDYSIPMLFVAGRAPAAASAAHTCPYQCAPQSVSSSVSSAHCSSSDCRSSPSDSCYNATFHLVNICPKEREDARFAATNQVSDATAAAWSDLIFDPEGECFDQLLDSLEGPSPRPYTSTNTSNVPLYMASGGVKDEPSGAYNAQFERFRSDSLDDVYALCADLF